MDNQYEKQFRESLSNNVSKGAPMMQKEQKNTVIVMAIVSAVLAVVTLVESVALVVVLTNSNNEVEISAEEIGNPDEDEEEVFVYDEENNMVAFELECEASNGDRIVFSKSNDYQEIIKETGSIIPGKYTISEDSLISLKPVDGQERVLNYDGFDVAEGSGRMVYNCLES